MQTALYAFGPFRYDTRTARLTRDGEDIALGRRASLILETLLRSGGDIVRKQDLIDAAWGTLAIEESNLSVQISKLRRIIGNDTIRTIERVGYRFVAPQPAPATEPRGRSTFPSVALLSVDGLEQMLAEVTLGLARFQTLRVLVPDAVASADYLVHLAVRSRADMMASLADCRAGEVIWASHFDMAPPELAADRIAAAIESQIETAEFTRGPSGSDSASEAYGLYRRGRRALHSSREADNQAAVALFLAAIELEPENAAYLAAATEAMHHRLSVGWQPLGPDDKRVCASLAYRTLAVAGNDAVAIALAGNGLITADEEDLGIELCRRALQMNPLSPLVLACAMNAERWGGSIEASEAIGRRASELAPNDPGQRFFHGTLASIAAWRGDHEGSLALGRRSLAFGPGYVGGHHSIIESLIGLGRRDEAAQQFERYRAMSPGVTIASFELGQHFADRSRLKRRIDSLRVAGMPER